MQLEENLRKHDVWYILFCRIDTGEIIVKQQRGNKLGLKAELAIRIRMLPECCHLLSFLIEYITVVTKHALMANIL